MLYPTLTAIRSARVRLQEYTDVTPSIELNSITSQKRFGEGARIYAKLELFQKTGSFKARGAINNLLQLNKQQLNRGVTAVSAGNHAIAVAYAAQRLGTSAKLVMPKNAQPYRIEQCESYGGEVVFANDVVEAFKLVESIADSEQRTFIHPFSGMHTLEGSGVVGLEMTEQMPPLDIVLLPIGGGGLCAGVAAALRQSWPNIHIVGVEPEGSSAMQRAFTEGKPVQLAYNKTIADSLAPPMTTEFTFKACRALLDDLILVSDEQIKEAMACVHTELKCAVEPAGAVATAGLLAQRPETLAGKKVGIILCGANITTSLYCQYVNG